MRTLPVSLALAASLLNVGYASAQFNDVREEVDPNGGLKKLTLTGIRTESCPGDPASAQDGADVRLTISADPHSSGQLWYFLSTDIFHGPTLGLRRGDKIQTKIGGTSASFNTINGSSISSRIDEAGKPLKDELISFHLHQGDLIALSRSSLLELQIVGPGGVIHRCAKADQFAHLGEFIMAASYYEPTHLVPVSQ